MRLSTIRELVALPNARQRSSNVEESQNLTKLSVFGDYALQVFSGLGSQRKISFSPVLQHISSRVSHDEDREVSYSPDFLTSKGAFSFKDDLFKEHSVVSGYFLKQLNNREDVSNGVAEGINNFNSKLDGLRVIYSVSSYGRLRMWTFSGANSEWVLSASLLLHDFPRKITNAWLDYYNGVALSVLWVDSFDSSFSIHQADVFVEYTKGNDNEFKAYQFKMLKPSSGRDIHFSLGPSRKIISQSLSDSPIKPPTFAYKDRTLWILSTKHNEYLVTIVDLSKSTTVSISIDRDCPINYNEDVIQLVQFFDASLEHHYSQEFNSKNTTLLQFQCIQTDDCIYLIYYHPMTGHWMKSRVVIPSNSQWMDICNHKINTPSKHSATRPSYFHNTHVWPQAKLQILCYDNETIYVSVLLPMFSQMCLGKINCPSLSNLPMVGDCYLEILTQCIPLISPIDSPHFHFSHITYETTVLCPASHSATQGNDGNSLPFLLKSTKPWEVISDSILRLPLFLIYPVDNNSISREEIIYLEIQPKKQSLQQDKNLDFSKFDDMTQIFDAIFSMDPGALCSARKRLPLISPPISPQLPPAVPKESSILNKYDHLSSYRESQQIVNSSSFSHFQVTSPVVHRLEHVGQALYDLMTMSGVLENKLIAGKKYYRLINQQENVSSRHQLDGNSSVATWAQLCAEAKNWVPLNYQEFLFVSNPKFKEFMLNTGLSEKSHKHQDPWVFENEDELLCLTQTTLCQQHSASEWRRNWMDTLDIVHLCPSRSAHSSLSLSEPNSPFVASSSTMDIIAQLLSPETFLQLLSSSHSYAAAKIMYPALWEESCTHLAITENAPEYCDPVMTLVQWLLFNHPDHLYLVIDMLLQAHKRLLLHDLQILYGDMASIMFEKYQYGRYVLGHDEHWKSAADASDCDSEEEDADSVFISVPSEDCHMDASENPHFKSPSLSHLCSLVGGEEGGQEEMPVKSLGWGHILNFAFRPLLDVSLSTPKYSKDVQIIQTNYGLDSSGAYIRRMSSPESVMGSARSEENVDKETEESASETSSDAFGSGGEVLDLVHNSDKKEGEGFVFENHANEEEEDSVFHHHSIDHHRLRQKLRHGVLAVLSHHPSFGGSDMDPSAAISATSLTPVQEDALLRVLLRSGHYLDVARILLKMHRFAQLYRLALRLCLVSNLHDHLEIVREEDFDPEHGAPVVTFHLLPAEMGQIWHNYYHRQETVDAVIKSIFDEDLKHFQKCEDPSKEEETEVEDWETLSIDIDPHQHQEDAARLRDHSEEILTKFGDVVLTVLSWKEAPPTLHEVQRKVERSLPAMHHHRQRQAREVFACTLRVMLALLYQQSGPAQRWSMICRVVKLLRRCPIDLISDNRLGRLVEQSLPLAPLEAQEQRRATWRKVVEYLLTSTP